MVIDRLEKHEKEWMFDPKADKLIDDALDVMVRFLRRTYPPLFADPYGSEQFFPGEIVLAPQEFFSGPLLSTLREDPKRFATFLDQGMVLEIQRSRKILYVNREDYELNYKNGSLGRAITEVHLARRILEIITNFWPRTVMAAQVPGCIHDELEKRLYENNSRDGVVEVPTYPRAMFENLTRDEYSKLLARLDQEGKILPAKKYRALLTRGNNDPPEGEEKYIVLTGARIHLCTINKEGLLIPHASLGVRFDQIICQRVIAWSLSRKLAAEHLIRLFGSDALRSYKRPPEHPCDILARKWAQKVLAQLGFRPNPVMGDFPLYRAYLESQIGQAVVREFGKNRPTISIEEYLDPPVPEKATHHVQ